MPEDPVHIRPYKSSDSGWRQEAGGVPLGRDPRKLLAGEAVHFVGVT